MAPPQLLFFIGWLAVALVCGALLYFGWERLRVKYGPQ
jgi:hypothetical protein